MIIGLKAGMLKRQSGNAELVFQIVDFAVGFFQLMKFAFKRPVKRGVADRLRHLGGENGNIEHIRDREIFSVHSPVQI